MHPQESRDRDRTAELAEAFQDLARSMASGYDVVDLLDRIVEHCVKLVGVEEAGLVLADPAGRLTVMAATSEQARFLELFQLQVEHGPCLECVNTGAAVAVPDLAAGRHRWAAFVDYALREGYRSVQAVPLSVSGATIGALNLFSSTPSVLSGTDVKIAQALADVATVAILHQRAVKRSELVAEQLRGALQSRVVIEQAKGKLAQQGGLDVGAAFVILRNYARRTNRKLGEVAQAVVKGTVTLPEIDGGRGGA